MQLKRIWCDGYGFPGQIQLVLSSKTSVIVHKLIGRLEYPFTEKQRLLVFQHKKTHTFSVMKFFLGELQEGQLAASAITQ